TRSDGAAPRRAWGRSAATVGIPARPRIPGGLFLVADLRGRRLWPAGLRGSRFSMLHLGAHAHHHFATARARAVPHGLILGRGERRELLHERGHGPKLALLVRGSPGRHGREFDSVLDDPVELGRLPIARGLREVRWVRPRTLPELFMMNSGCAV